jgi:hypothetical protein
MIVSKSSWHYRLFAWTKTHWSDGTGINKRHDLCSYISTILLQAPLVGALWLLSVIGGLIVSFFETVEKVWDYAFETRKRSIISYALIFAAVNGLMLGLYIDSGYPAGEAATSILAAWGIVAAIVLGVVACILVLVLGVGYLLPWLFEKGQAKGSSFVQLTKTWVNDGAGKRFCRTLTFVD